MFKSLKFFVYTLVIIFTFVPLSWAVAQTTADAGFGVDADIHSNRTEIPPVVPVANTDDWFFDTTGTGVGVIDTVGGGAFRAYLLAADLVGRNKTFVRHMNPALYPPYIDAVYVRDHFSVDIAVDSSTFYSGSNKNADNPATWNVGIGTSPPKNDIIDAAAHMRLDDGDSLWLFAYMTTLSADGNSHLDFEFFATDAQYDTGTGLTGLGPDSGHTVWTFDESLNILQTGDVIFSVDFEQGGEVLYKSVYIWVHQDVLLKNPAPFTFTGVFESGGQSGPYGYAEIVPLNGVEYLYTVANFPPPNGNGNTAAAPWGSLEGASATFSDNILETQLTEIGINLTALGIIEGEDLVLGNILFKSRASSSFTSELKDFVGPQGFGIFTAQCQIECPDGMTVECFDDIPTGASNLTEFLAQGGSVSNCLEPVFVTYFDGSLTGGSCGGTVVRTYVLTDSLDNVDSCEQVFTVDDNTPPVITCPADLSVDCNGSTDPANTGTATATDNCDTSPVVTYADVVIGNIITRTWTTTDVCGNTDQCIQTITIVDTTPPVITCPADLTVDCSASTDPANTGSATATDNCDPTPVVTYIDSEIPGACLQEKIITRTWTATDASNNSIQCVQTITVEDNTAPVIAGCPGDVTVECDAIPTVPTLTATDDCDPAPVVTLNEVSNLTGCGNYTGTIARTWTAVDACGNPSQCVQVITVVDNTLPVITCPADLSVDCNGSTDPANTGTATATDNCDAAPVVTYADVVTSNVITRTWTATDACGNSDQCVQIITIEDTTPPDISCPTNLTIDCTASTDPANTGSATATDNCDPAPVITYSDSEVVGACPQEVVITRTWTATDIDNNSSQCVQIITVEDNTIPVITCPADLSVDCNGSVDTSATGSATATDDCTATGNIVIAYSDNQVGNVLTRTWTATDECGNVSQCDQVITVADITPPVITCPADLTIDCTASTDPANTGSATATDNCDPTPLVTYNDSETPGACLQEKVITRTWTATDASNNSSQCVQTITVEDNTAPVIAGCPGDVTVECDAIPTVPTLTATDDCDPAPVVTLNEVSNLTGCGNLYRYYH